MLAKQKGKLKIAAAAECCFNCLVRMRCLNLGVCLGFFWLLSLILGHLGFLSFVLMSFWCR